VNVIEMVVYRYRQWRYREPPLPRIGTPMRWSLPAWIVRVLAAVVVGLGVGVSAGLADAPWQLTGVLVLGLGLWGLVWPGFGPGLAAIGGIGLMLLFSPGVVGVGVGVVVALGYLGLRLQMIAGLTAWHGRVALGALLTWRDAVVLGVTLLIGLAVLLPGGGPVPVIVGAAALVAAALVVRRVL